MSKRICGECTEYNGGMCANFDSSVSFTDKVCKDFCPCEEWEPMFEVEGEEDEQ